MIRRRLVATAVIAAFAVTVAACGGDDDAPPPTTDVVAPVTTEPAPVTTPPAPEPTAPPTTAEPPVTSVTSVPDAGVDWPERAVLDDVVGWLNGEPIDRAEYHERFAAAFVEVVPYDDFEELLVELVDQAPWELVDDPIDHEGTLSVELNDADGDRYRLGLALEESDGRIGLLFVERIFDDPDSPGEALRRLNELGTLRFVEAEIEDDECRAVIEVDADEPMPLGSAFKLYVLGAVVDAVAAGTIDWDTLVEVRDELRSIPAGITQDDPAGTEHTVEELATRMISISDNTATDLLIDLVGRTAVESALTRYGHAEPSATLPLLTTRELTILKFGDEELAGRYVAAPTHERRRILDDEVAAADLPPDEAITIEGVATAETIEWFASPLDICRAFAELARSDDALEILSINPGVPPSTERWSYIGFKGGSSPGVLAAGWLVEDEEGVRTVIAGGVSNNAAPIPDVAAIEAFALLRDTASP